MISSIAYATANAQVAMFSRALHAEFKSKGVHIQCQMPMFVATKMSKIRQTSLFVPSPEQYARAAVATIGYEALVSPYWCHALQIWILINLPEWLISLITLNIQLRIRAAGLRKATQEKGANENNPLLGP